MWLWDPLRLYNLRRADKTDENASGLGADSILNGPALSNNHNCRRPRGRGRGWRLNFCNWCRAERRKKGRGQRCHITILKWQPVNNHHIPENTGELCHQSFFPKINKPTTSKQDILLWENWWSLIATSPSKTKSLELPLSLQIWMPDTFLTKKENQNSVVKGKFSVTLERSALPYTFFLKMNTKLHFNISFWSQFKKSILHFLCPDILSFKIITCKHTYIHTSRIYIYMHIYIYTHIYIDIHTYVYRYIKVYTWHIFEDYS